MVICHAHVSLAKFLALAALWQFEKALFSYDVTLLNTCHYRIWSWWWHQAWSGILNALTKVPRFSRRR